ncbi:MAG TPA: AAA family ATPase [Thermomicrobiaceae bacterium]|nr:AAA family ATPase [Thermomicrobiaceae bacterium]
MSVQAPYVFVSYASRDRERVLPLVARLEAAGVQTWVDREGIHGGANYALEIAEAIEQSAALLLFCSDAALASRNVKQELALAWRFEKPYLPLLLDPVEIPKDVAYWLEGAQWIELLERPEEVWRPAVLTALRELGMPLAEPEPGRATGRSRPLVVGREREQAALRAQLDRMLAAQGGTVLVGGEAGIGKTTLVEDLSARAEEAGALALWGHAYDLSVTRPHGPWLEILRQYQTLAAGLPPVPAFVSNADELAKVGSQETLFAAVADFFTVVAAQRPLLLVLDDLHWADQASLDFFRYLARQLGRQRLLLVATYRSDELTRRHPLAMLLPLLVREAAAERVDVRPLNEAGQYALIQHRYQLDEADQARLERYLQEHAEGNPFFTVELLRTLEEEQLLARQEKRWALGDLEQAPVPPLLRQVIEGRVSRLDEESQRVLEAAAVIGQSIPLSLWAALGEVGEDTLFVVAERAEEAHLLEEAADGSGVRFLHALIREALYQGIPSFRRRRLHRRAGEILAAAEAPDPDRVAYHLQQAGDVRAAEWLIRAGERAQRAYAWHIAVDRFEAALARLTEQDATAREQAVLLFRIAFLLRFLDVRKALGHLDEARRLALEAGEIALASRCLHLSGLLHCFLGEPRRGIVEMEQAVSDLHALPDDEQTRLPLLLDADLGPPEGTLALWLGATGQLEAGVALARRMLAATPQPALRVGQGDSLYADGLFGLGWAEAMLAHPRDAREALQQARAVYQSIEHHYLVAYCTFCELEMVRLPYFARERDTESRLTAESTEAMLKAGGAAPERVPSELPSLCLQVLQGDWRAARGVAEAAHGHSRWMIMGLASHWLAVLAQRQGDEALAWRVISERLPDGPRTDPGNTFISSGLPLQRLAAELALDAHDLPTARAWLEAHDRWLAWSSAVLGRAEGAVLWAVYHHVAGDQAEARRLAEQALAHASDPSQPLALIAAHRFLGRLDTEEEQFGAAEGHLQQSLALAEARAAPFERALTLLETVALRAAQRKPDEARSLLDEVRAICEPLGAKPALGRVAALKARLDAPETTDA